MQLFTYHRQGETLRTHVTALLLVAGFELVAWAVVIPFLPRPWNLAVLAVVLLITAIAVPDLIRLLTNRHRLTDSTLTLTYGKASLLRAWSLAVPLSAIAGAGLHNESVRRLAAAITPVYRPEDDTLYVLAGKRGLVQLSLDSPLQTELIRQGAVQFTRIVLSLDSPAQFLAALAAAGVPAGDLPERHEAAPLPALPGPVPSPGAPEAAAICLRDLKKQYGDLTAVAGVSLAVAPGEVLAFLGSNGAGKTTTIRMITGLLRPTAGQVLIRGRDLWQEGSSVRRLVGYVPDVPLLYEGLTAREFLWLVAGLYDLPAQAGRRRAEELLAFLDMQRWGDHLIRTFSLGMKRKMAIAAALVHNPPILLLDEPTNGLDPRATRDVKDFIASTAAAGTAVFLTTHLLDLARELAHRIAIIDRGRLRAVGTLAELQALAGQPGAGLEAVFLALTGPARPGAAP